MPKDTPAVSQRPPLPKPRSPEERFTPSYPWRFSGYVGRVPPTCLAGPGASPGKDGRAILPSNLWLTNCDVAANVQWCRERKVGR
jgi:hypothetical protein